MPSIVHERVSHVPPMHTPPWHDVPSSSGENSVAETAGWQVRHGFDTEDAPGATI
jgi:hypothetical protein